MPVNVNTSINQNQLPRDIATPNQFVSYSNSFILMPMLGPLMINKRLKNIAHGIYYLNKLVKLINTSIDIATKKNKKQFNIYTDLGIKVPDIRVENILKLAEKEKITTSAATASLFSDFVKPDKRTITSTTGNTATTTAMLAPETTLLKPLTEINPVFDMAFDIQKILKTGVLASTVDIRSLKALNNEKQKYIYILEKFIKPSAASATSINNNAALLKKGADLAKSFTGNTPRQMLNGGRTAVDKKARDLLSRFLLDILDKDFDIYSGADLSKADANSEDTEWALIRKDRITVELKDKLFRGPVETISISPNAVSEVSNSYESVISRQSGRENVSSSSTMTRRSRSVADNIASSVTNSVENGARTQASFNNTSIIRNSLTERLRSATREELNIISQMNRQASLSSFQETRSSNSMYRTEGVDENLANTEVLFESFVKTTVTSKLDDIGLVWCPRFHSPYININRQINRAAEQARLDYERINYIVDPAEPPIYTESEELYFEIDASGKHRSQQFSTTVTIPANLRSEEWELNEDDVVTGFRNGTSDDYDWYEAWNWDDLENWSTTLLSLTRRGDNLDVTVRLETTDPELLNRGFITVSVFFEKLTEESKAQLSAYEQQRETSRLERRSVRVRARQLAELKKQELINNTVKSSDEIKKILIYDLLRQISIPSKRKNISLYYETLKSCLDWDAIYVENEISANPPYPLYPMDHFINTSHARIFMPIRKEKEADFSNLVKEFTTNVYSAKIDQIINIVKSRRTEIANMTSPPTIFRVEGEIVLGVHRENVFSNTNFKFV